MDNPCVRRHDAEVVKSLLAPAQEFVALAVALVLFLAVDPQGGRAAVGVHLHRVVDDQVAWHLRIDLPRVAAQFLHRVAQGG